jgi:hypothetical protein
MPLRFLQCAIASGHGSIFDVIIAVENGIARDLQSWCFDTHHEFLPERLMVSDITLPQVMPNLEDALEN